MQKKTILITALLSAVSTMLLCFAIWFFTLSDVDRLALCIRLGYAGEFSETALSEGAARGMVEAAKENAALSGLSAAPIRYIVDDCRKFMERELRRGNRYDGIIMDPPSYGRGPTGEVWKIEESIDSFVELSAKLLSDNPLFFLLNSYTTGLSASAMRYIVDLRVARSRGGRCEADEIGLFVEESGLTLPAGSSVRCTF